ncbi:MAG: type I phosphomannose isomerase catalytic subunit [Culicoidibacterales bacterium]
MYPIQFENLYYEKIWGGRALEKIRQNLPSGNIGESWDVALHPNGTSVVANGSDKGKTFGEIIATYQELLLGTKVTAATFPLLVKVITADENLSIQVHPGDEYAQEHENQLGKTEAWYVLAADEGAELIIGVKPGCEQDYQTALTIGTDLLPYLNRVRVTVGDCFLIPNGCVHAIGAGVTLLEIQQNSDVTYRLYDYGRPREIHVQQGIAVTDFTVETHNAKMNPRQNYDGYSEKRLCENNYFIMEELVMTEKMMCTSTPEHFTILTCVAGHALLVSDELTVNMTTGDSILIPAALGDYQLQGASTIIRSYPNVG